MKAALVTLCALTAALPMAAKTISVDCTKGQHVQDAIDKNSAPLVIDIHGICVENVTIAGKDFTLKGTDPATDGIQGASDTALTVNQVVSGSITNLSFSNGPRGGIRVSAGSFVSCEGCRLENNASYAASATSGGRLVLGDSVVGGPFGLQAVGGGSTNTMSCSAAPATPCGLAITQRAASATEDGRVNFFNAGNFQGQVDALVGGSVRLDGTRQLPWAVPPALFNVNHAGGGGTITAQDFTDENNTTHTSQVGLHTTVITFGRFVASGSTTVAASVQCFSAGDAWVDATATKNAGVTITGCEHAQ